MAAASRDGNMEVGGCMDSSDIARLKGCISGCHDPAYTYVFKMPFLGDLRGWERDMQWGLAINNREGLDDTLDWSTRLNPSNPQQQRLFLQAHGEEKYYARFLARAVHNSCVRFFQYKQATGDANCTVYTQAEISGFEMHIHVVMAGPGLNKWNARGATRALQTQWLKELIVMLDATCRGIVPENRTDVIKLLGIIRAAHDRTVADEGYKLVDVLKYRTRSGGEHVARVNGAEYITNYLLCKNWQPFVDADPLRCTLAGDFFEGIRKTYAATLVNGEPIPLGTRKRMWQELKNSQEAMATEPSFSGEPFATLPQVPRAQWKGTERVGGAQKMNKREGMMLDCLQRCKAGNILTYEQLVNNEPDLVVMMEAIPGGAKLIEQVLHMLHIQVVKGYTPLGYLRHLDAISTWNPDNKAAILLHLQGYNPWQVGHWVITVLNKQAGKQNTINFYGPASTGKTNLAKAIVGAVRLYGCVNHQNKNFIFNDCAHKLVVWWEECLMHADWVEQAKCILGGTEFRIDRKHRDSQLLPQTPVIISTNHDIYTVVGGNTVSQVHAKPLKERIVQLNFMKRLNSTFGEITTEEIHGWLNACYTRYEPTLQAYLREWKLERVSNTFPTQESCCPQDYVLYENASVCSHCGGIPELETRDRGQTESAEPPTKRLRVEDPEVVDKEPQPSTSGTNVVRNEPKFENLDDLIKEQEELLGVDSGRLQEITPEQWGELLGVVTSESLEEEPTVLYCFEQLEESDGENNAN
uniref:Initiator protein NS1 n=1 Tax=Rhinolophus bat parvovirus TaxID=3038986 RepID=A0AAT9TYI7_9VIRU|nr:MAG: NS1 [Rhinolophus bat parvovirus]